MSADDTRRVMSAYFEALETGRFSGHFTDDVTWTTTANENACGVPRRLKRRAIAYTRGYTTCRRGNW